jgi:hypothetical protein
MLGFLLRLIAAVLIFRVVGGLMRYFIGLPRGESGTPLEESSRGRARAAKPIVDRVAKPLVDRASAIDVPFTEEPREG